LDRPSLAKRSLPPAALAHHELLFAIDPLEPFSDHLVTFTAQQHVKPATAEKATLLGERLQSGTQLTVVGTLRRLPDRGPVGPNHSARPPLVHFEDRP